MTEKERIVDAIVWHVNYRLGDKGEMYVINGKLAWGLGYNTRTMPTYPSSKALVSRYLHTTRKSIGLETSLISIYSSITKSLKRYVRILQSTSTPKKRG